MARHSGGDMSALLSGIALSVPTTAIPVVPIVALTSSGASSSPASSRSTSGRGIIVRVVVLGDDALTVCVHPVMRRQSPATTTRARDWRI